MVTFYESQKLWVRVKVTSGQILLLFAAETGHEGSAAKSWQVKEMTSDINSHSTAL